MLSTEYQDNVYLFIFRNLKKELNLASLHHD